MKIIFKIAGSIDGQAEMVKYFYDSFEDSMKTGKPFIIDDGFMEVEILPKENEPNVSIEIMELENV